MIRQIGLGLILLAMFGTAKAGDNPWCADFEFIANVNPLAYLAFCQQKHHYEWLNPNADDSLVINEKGWIYKLDPKTGFLTLVWPLLNPPPKPAASRATLKAQGIGASDAASDMTGRFQYVGLSGSDKIGAYRFDPATGERFDVPGAPFAAGKVPSAVVVHPSNKFLYATNAISDNISAYRIDAATGALTPNGVVPTRPLPQSAAIHPSGRFLYVTSASGSGAPSFLTYRVDVDTGALTPFGSPFATGNFPDSIAVDPYGRFVYFATTGHVEGYQVAATGTLTKIAGSPFSVPGAMRLAIGGAGRFLYTANAQMNNVAGFAVDPSSGALTPVPGSPFANGKNPSWIVIDSTGKFVLVANTGSLTGGTDSISVFSIDANTGALQPIPGSPIATTGQPTPDVFVAVPVFKDSFAQVGSPYASVPFRSLGGTPPYTWTLDTGSLPAGISLDAQTGALSGTPTALGTFVFNLKGTDAAGASNSRAMFITVNTLGTPGDKPIVASSTPVAVEYFHAGFGHYFVTTIGDEMDKLDTGSFKGWARTGQAFNVYAAADTGLVPVCRFFTIAFPPSSSHFYAPRGLGCEPTFADSHWQYEGDVFFTALPDASGACPAGNVPVYRLYNNGQGGAPNHRFTTSASIRAQMLAAGFLAEGSGIGVGMCSPQ